jgi:hypothetical protein
MKKASEIFLEYVQPLHEIVSFDADAKTLTPFLRVPEWVWNAVVMSTWDTPKRDYLAKVYKSLQIMPSSSPHADKSLIDFWVQRKKQLYPEARWAFVIKVRDGKEGSVIRANVHAPAHLHHTIPKEWQHHEKTIFADFTA